MYICLILTKIVEITHKTSSTIISLFDTYKVSLNLPGSKEGLKEKLGAALGFPFLPCPHFSVSGWLLQERNMSRKWKVWVPWSHMLLRTPSPPLCIWMKSGSESTTSGASCPHFLSCRHDKLALNSASPCMQAHWNSVLMGITKAVSERGGKNRGLTHCTYLLCSHVHTFVSPYLTQVQRLN